MELFGLIININTFLKILLIAILSYLSINIISKVLDHISEKFTMDLTFVDLIKDLLKYFILIIAIAWILELFGIDFQNIILSLGVIGIIVGLASKDIVSNFMSGFFLIADQSIKVGEVIEVNNIKGTVKKFGFRNTLLINQDNQKITIPNSLLSKTTYTNFSPQEDHRVNLICVLPPEIDIDQFEKDLKKEITNKNWILKGSEVKIFGKSITAEGPEIKISIWIKDYHELDEKKLLLLNEVNKIINQNKEKNNISKIID